MTEKTAITVISHSRNPERFREMTEKTTITVFCHSRKRSVSGILLKDRFRTSRNDRETTAMRFERFPERFREMTE